MLSGSFLLTRDQRVVSVKSSLFCCPTSNANAPASKVAVNGARVGLVKNRIVIIEFHVTQVISQHINLYIDL